MRVLESLATLHSQHAGSVLAMHRLPLPARLAARWLRFVCRDVLYPLPWTRLNAVELSHVNMPVLCQSAGRKEAKMLRSYGAVKQTKQVQQFSPRLCSLSCNPVARTMDALY